MKAAYCEIKRGRNCVTVNYYSKEGYGLELGCRKLERERREAILQAEGQKQSLPAPLRTLQSKLHS